eukprot:scaffold1729_cov117-Cylindrotheca_fusiformis.AAC.12
MGEPLLLIHDTDLPATTASQQQPDTSGDSVEQKEVRLHGVVIGILAQVISVCGTAFICYKWDVETGLDASGLAHYLHWFLRIITQVDSLIFLLVWIGLSTMLTDTGEKRDEWYTGGDSARSTFVIAVTFLYAGAAMGLILSWALLNAAFGIRAPIVPIVGILVIGFLIVYAIIRCFDDDRNRGIDDDQNRDNEEVADEETAYRPTSLHESTTKAVNVDYASS